MNSVKNHIFSPSLSQSQQEGPAALVDNQTKALSQSSENFKVNNAFQEFISSCEYIVTHIEPLEKVTKNTYRLLDILRETHLSTAEAVHNLSKLLRGSADMIESVRFVGVFHQLLFPQSNGKYFLFDEKNSKAKRIDRIFLAGHTSLKTVRAFNKYNLIDLGEFAKLKIGSYLTVFQVLVDSLMIGSSFFSTIDAIPKLQNADNKLAEADYKIKKWEYRPTKIGYILAGDQKEIKACEAEYKKKLDALNEKIMGARKQLHFDAEVQAKAETLPEDECKKVLIAIAASSAQAENDIALLGKSVKKNEERLQKIASHDYKGLADDLSKTDAGAKVKKWQPVKEAQSDQRTLGWLRIASSVGKIFVIAMAFAFISLNWIVGLPMVALLAFGFIVDSIGLAKILFEVSLNKKNAAAMPA